MASIKQETENIEASLPVSNQDREHSMVDLDRPHLAAIEDNCQIAKKPSTATFIAIFFLGLSIVCPTSLGFLVVSGVLVSIGQSLGSTSNIQWVTSAYAVASALSFTIAGSLSDIFGRRYVIITGQAISILGAIVGATAKETNTLIAAGALLGFSSGLVLIVYAAIPELCPYKYRGLGLAWIEICILLPWGTLSVFLGNQIVAHSSWRWIYYIAIIYGVVSTAGSIIFYFPPSRPRHDDEKSRLDQLKELDYIGFALYTAGLTILLVGLSWAGTAGHAWRDPSVVAPIVIGAVLFFCCFGYDWFITKQSRALFPLHLFVRFREYTVSLVVVFVAGMIFYSMATLLPQATLYIFTSDHAQIGIIQLTNGLGQTVGATLGPLILHKTKNIKSHIILALLLQTIGTALYAYALPAQNKAAWMAFQFFGQGCFSWLSVCCIMNAGLQVKQSELGLATGLIGTFRSSGGSLGSAIFSTILTTVSSKQLVTRITQAAVANGFDPSHLSQLIPAVHNAALGVPSAFIGVPGASLAVQDAVLEAFKEAYAYAFARVFYATIPFGIIAIIAACFIKDAGQFMTNHTSVALERDVLDKDIKKEKEGDSGNGV